MNCLNCGSPRNSEFRFCLECGLEFKTDEENIQDWENALKNFDESKLTTNKDDLEIELLIEEETNLEDPNPNDTLPPFQEESRSLNLNNANPIIQSTFETPNPNDTLPPRHFSNFCLLCGAKLEPKHRFCGQCGTPRGQSEPPDKYQHSSETEKGTKIDILRKTKKQLKAKLCLLDDSGNPIESFPIYENENLLTTNDFSPFKNQKLQSICAISVRNNTITLIPEDDNTEIYCQVDSNGIEISNKSKIRVGETCFLFTNNNEKKHIVFSKEHASNITVAGGPDPKGWGYLEIILSNGQSANVYRLKDPEVTIGRTDATILLEHDLYVSSTHARLKPNANTAILYDANSSNGTFAQIKTKHQLTKDSIILINGHLFIIEQ